MTLASTLRSAAVAFGLALWGLSAPAQAQAQAQVAADEQVEQVVVADYRIWRPALWVVRDADSTIYLFGTVHLMRPGDDWMTPRVTEAFDSAGALWLELSDPSDQAAALPLIIQHGISRDRTLRSRLTDGEYAQLDEAARTINSSAELMNTMRPWLAGLQLSVAPMVEAGYDPAAGVDMMLRARAIETGKPVEGLETMEQQILFFANLSEDDEMAFLRSTLDGFGEGVDQLDAMALAWSRGDPDALYALGGGELKTAYPHFYDTILTERNAAWANRIRQELAGSGTVFMAVGALHLSGPDSVQSQLEAGGVTVERLQ